ncbi:MAG: hypothetical protein ABFR90_10835 [Planctomycetota bacterium]
MGQDYGGVIAPYDPKRGIPRQATFKEGEIVEETLEHEPPVIKPPEKMRFDVGWPIRKSGEWLLEDRYKLDYAIDQLKDYVDHPAYEDMRGKTIKLAKAFARFRPPYSNAWEFLIESSVLMDGMTLEETRFLGRPTYQKDGYVRWYYNPEGVHVAPCLVAQIRDDKLYNWEVTRR